MYIETLNYKKQLCFSDLNIQLPSDIDQCKFYSQSPENSCTIIDVVFGMNLVNKFIPSLPHLPVHTWSGYFHDIKNIISMSNIVNSGCYEDLGNYFYMITVF